MEEKGNNLRKSLSVIFKKKEEIDKIKVNNKTFYKKDQENLDNYVKKANLIHTKTEKDSIVLTHKSDY